MSSDQNSLPDLALSRRRMLALTGGAAAVAAVSVPALARVAGAAPSTANVPEYSGADDWVSAGSNALGDTRSDVTAVVIHTTQGAYQGAINHMAGENGVAAHYVIRSSDGHMTQMVRENRISWHANSANSYSVGIEHEGWVEEPGFYYTGTMYRESAKLVQHLCSTWNIPQDRDHIIGHNEVEDATHTDPGPGWNWSYFMSLVRGESVSDEPPAPWTAARDTYSTVSPERSNPPQTSRVAQHLLNFRGADLEVDGVFGSVSGAAAREFQEEQGLTVDGVVGPQTFAELIAERRSGSDGHAVRAVQTALNKYGAGLEVDGSFGPVTDTAVKEFQDANDLTVDGIVGAITWRWIV
ncbi:hypothetical protein BJF85_09695 [Saccharomonospora sp. CUA-673]|uniref:peptidoglycan recognition protein family protein n=1 Tax=Saccharomonospora sp. CUA-673 TaxID=1904969 RepID=UPI00095AAAA3|nr:N-acetylmuramoyl-L-alanine amidase [Saccharomonospora sp. CUA-673]OLT49152.1 hypothetical protein BJF85_09695 [Saccharomonospora sp. CUA-673]